MATARKASAKKPVRKTAVKKTAAKRTTTKTATKKVAAKATTKVAAKDAAVKTTSTVRSKVLTPLQRLRNMHIVSTLTYTFFAILTAVFVGAAGAQLYLTSQARDVFANSNNVVLAPAGEVLGTLQYRYILIALLVVSALGSLLLATKLRRRYEGNVNAGVSGLRWLLMGVSAAITIEFVSFMAGVQDVMTLKTVAALVFASALFGWMAERDNLNTNDPKWLAFGGRVFTGVLAWLPAVGSLIGTTLLNEERFGWHVYALVAAAMLGSIAFAINQYSHIKKNNLEFPYVEQRYVRIDQLTKFAIVLIVFSSLAS
jgi:hypothetical protein